MERGRKVTVRLALTKIAKSHPDSAALILQTPSLREKIFNDGDVNTIITISDIAISHPRSAEIVLQTQYTQDKLLKREDPMSASYSLVRIAKSHPDAATYILKNQLFREKLLNDARMINFTLDQIAAAHQRPEDVQRLYTQYKSMLSSSGEVISARVS